MQNYIVIGGHSIEELEMNLAMAKKAIAMGVPCAVGGSSIEDVEQGMALMQSMMGDNTPIDNPNYIGVPPIEDEEEDEYCPDCGNSLDEDGYCDNCDYPDCECEDEEDELPLMLQTMVDMAKAMGVSDEIIEDALRYTLENDID